MKTGLALFCVFGLSLVFTMVGKFDMEPRSFFPMSDIKLTLDTYVYFIFEHLMIITIVFLWCKEASEYSKDYVLVFLFLQIGDLLDYLIRYNEPFYRFDFSIPVWVTYNMVMTILYGVFIVIKAWKTE